MHKVSFFSLGGRPLNKNLKSPQKVQCRSRNNSASESAARLIIILYWALIHFGNWFCGPLATAPSRATVSVPHGTRLVDPLRRPPRPLRRAGRAAGPAELPLAARAPSPSRDGRLRVQPRLARALARPAGGLRLAAQRPLCAQGPTDAHDRRSPRVSLRRKKRLIQPTSGFY